MALPDSFRTAQGTAIVWGDAGGSGVTNTMTLDALADGSARMGAEADLGATFYQRYAVYLYVETGTAPAAGVTVELYLAWSLDGTFYPAGVTGSDGAWPSDGNEDEWAKQLELVGSLVATADGNTQQGQGPWIVYAKGRYVVPVVDNNLAQAFRDQATASNNLSRVIMIPLDDQVID